MDLFVFSLNHRVTPFAGLERALTPAALAGVRAWVHAESGLLESTVLTTCGRLEVYGVGDLNGFRSGFARILHQITGDPELPVQIERGEDAVRHLLGVAAGLDSILWGEIAVAQQVRAAYRRASDEGDCGPWLHRLFHTALRGGRRIRRDGPVTAIHDSLSARAVEAILRPSEPDRPASVVVIGAGAAGAAALRALRSRGVARLALVASRPAEAVNLAQENDAQLYPAGDLRRALALADAVITVSDRGRLLGASTLRALVAERGPSAPPLRIVDLGMPRNVDPAARKIAGLTLFDLRDLASEAPRSTNHAHQVRDLVVAQYEAWRTSRLDPERPTPGSATAVGRVSLVGAGPGDPELLTVKALRLLQSADIVFYDALVPEVILDCIPRGTRRVPVGRRKGQSICEQENIHRGMIAWARRGARVVRLKGGDPMVFGRGAEELAALEAAAVPVEIVPAVTAATAAAASAGVGLTHRGHAASCALVTLHQAEAGPGGDTSNWSSLRALARTVDTLAVYMGATRIPALARELLAAGRPPEQLLVVVEKAQQPDCRLHWLSLAEAARCRTTFARPALVLAGPSVAAARHGQQEPISALHIRENLEIGVDQVT